MHEENFTPTQVGTLLEAMDKKIDLIAETVLPMKEDIAVLKERVSELSSDMRAVKDVIRVEIPSMRSRIAALETRP